MNEDAKAKLAEAGVKVGVGLFSRLMDRMAAKRPNGLVARFRRRVGRITPEQLEDAGNRAVDAVRERKKR